MTRQPPLPWHQERFFSIYKTSIFRSSPPSNLNCLAPLYLQNNSWLESTTSRSYLILFLITTIQPLHGAIIAHYHLSPLPHLKASRNRKATLFPTPFIGKNSIEKQFLRVYIYKPHLALKKGMYMHETRTADQKFDSRSFWLSCHAVGRE